MARHLPGFSYDPRICRFKTWLLNQTSWRIKDHVKKRARAGHGAAMGAVDVSSDRACTAAIERVADPSAVELDALFESEWRSHLLLLAMEAVKEPFSLKQIQIFDLAVEKEWPAGEVARSLGVSRANVCVTKHRIERSRKRAIQKLEAKTLWPPT